MHVQPREIRGNHGNRLASASRFCYAPVLPRGAPPRITLEPTHQMIDAAEPETLQSPSPGLENPAVLEFAVFCIENVADALGKTSADVYRALSGANGILLQYIVPCYDVLHTQGKAYIVDDILDVMKERGVTV